MTVTYRNMGWQFDTEAFTDAIASIPERDRAALAQLMSLTPETMDNWAKGRYHVKFPYPNMTNLLFIANYLDMNPAQFFRLA